MADAATGSVGDTTAPSTKAACHDIPAMSSWATTATPTIVKMTRPIASRLISRMLSRSSRSEEKKAAE
jgi:hypothetical protein